jgi:selenocysteine lyase/cysteine desulfurase
MIQTKDKILIKCHPSNVISWDDYVEDCNLAVNTVDINSDEYSTEEEELARKERSDEKRPENIYSTNSVIKICDKPWRSTRVCNNVCEIIEE